MKRLGMVVLLVLAGLFGAWQHWYSVADPAPQEHLLNKEWRWVSWTEQVGTKAAQERIRPCQQDDVIRFAQLNGQNVYTERAGGVGCEFQTRSLITGEWDLAPDGSMLTISGGNATFEDTWQVSELTAHSLKLAYRTKTSAGPFVMTMTFVPAH